MARNGSPAGILVGALMWGGIAASAQATPITFDFNSITPVCPSPAYGNPCSASTATTDNGHITTYMNSVLGPAGMGTVTLNTGTQSIKTLPDEAIPTWNQTGSFKTSNQVYLGNSDGATDYTATATHAYASDTYLINAWQSQTASEADRIVMSFSHPISAVAFDWQIFPYTWNSSNPPDIQVFADLSDGRQVQIFGEVLGSSTAAGTTCGVLVACPNPTSTTYGTTLTNHAWAQTGDLGHFNTFNFNSTGLWCMDVSNAGGTCSTAVVTRLEFVDWTTAPVGIDNLTIGTSVPEPSSWLLLGVGLAGLATWRWMQRAC